METSSILESTRKLSLSLCTEEMLIFSKWIYRHRNQQRRYKCFQKLLQIEKSFKKYQSKDHITNIKDTVKQCINSSGRVVPSSQLTSAHKMITDCLLYVVRLLNLMESTFYDIYKRIQIGHLLYPYIVIIASLSRLWFYMRTHVLVLCELQYSLSSSCEGDPTTATPSMIIDYSKVLRKEDICYIPLRMRTDFTNSNNETSEQLQVSTELKAKRERDIMGLTSSYTEGSKNKKQLRKEKKERRREIKQRQAQLIRRAKLRKIWRKLKRHNSPAVVNLKLKKHSILNHYKLEKIRFKKKGKRNRRKERREGKQIPAAKLQNKFVTDINRACDNLIPISNFHNMSLK